MRLVIWFGKSRKAPKSKREVKMNHRGKRKTWKRLVNLMLLLIISFSVLCIKWKQRLFRFVYEVDRVSL